MGDRVGAIMEARAIGALSYRKTLQNLWLAFLFNGIGVPLAATGLVHPSWAMIAMAVSVSAVLANSFGAGVLKSFGSAHAAATDAREASGSRAAGIERATLSVPGIYCAGCVETIEAYLMTARGVDSVAGDAKRKEITVSFDPDTVTREKLGRMINEIGYLVA